MPYGSRRFRVSLDSSPDSHSIQCIGSNLSVSAHGNRIACTSGNVRQTTDGNRSRCIGCT